MGVDCTTDPSSHNGPIKESHRHSGYGGCMSIFSPRAQNCEPFVRYLDILSRSQNVRHFGAKLKIMRCSRDRLYRSFGPKTREFVERNTCREIIIYRL